MTSVTAADKFIWETPSGTVLRCIKSVVMKDGGEVAFTQGHTYVVQSMHPIAEPAYIRLINDQGTEHKMHGEHLREFFARR